jgi:DNA modification methylase
MKIETWLLKNLQLDPNNARKHDQRNLDAIKASLEKFGQRKPIVVTADGVVLAGNGTVTAAKALGWDEISVAVAPTEWDAETAKAYALADNKSAELADWDYKILQSQLIELDTSGWDIESLGFDIPEPVELPTAEADEIPELPADPICRPGDVWKLGNHILICGDSTSPSTYEKLMGESKAQIVVTDPPWNVNYGAVEKGNAQGYKPRTIMNDHMEDDQWAEFVDGFVSQIKDNSAPGAMIYLVMSAQEWPVIDGSLRFHGFHWSSTIIWAKDRLVLSRKDYHTQYEPIWYGWNEDGPRLSPLEDRKQSDLWQINRPSVSELHPTTKPVELITKMLQNSSKPHDIVLEPFGGSGSTLIACEDTNRYCRAVELDPKYVDVIVKRWENHTGNKAELVNG